MILYIADKDNENLFTDYIEQQSRYLDFKELTDKPLKYLISKERNMPNYQYVFFCFTDTTYFDEVLETVSFIRKFHHAKVILFAPEGVQTTALFGKLIDEGIHEVVAYNDITDLEAELEECLSYEGKGFVNSVQVANTARIEEARSLIRPVLEIPENFALKLGIVGAQARTGVTTQIFAFYHTLIELGFTPLIIDTKQAFISALLKLYGDEESINGGILTIKGMEFSHDIQVGTGHNAFLYDLGTLDDTSSELFASCDIRLLCSGAKGWELPVLSKCIVKYPELPERLILSFVAKNDESECFDLLSGLIPISFADYSPDIWKQGSNAWQDEFLVPMIKELIGK